MKRHPKITDSSFFPRNPQLGDGWSQPIEGGGKAYHVWTGHSWLVWMVRGTGWGDFCD